MSILTSSDDLRKIDTFLKTVRNAFEYVHKNDSLLFCGQSKGLAETKIRLNSFVLSGQVEHCCFVCLFCCFDLFLIRKSSKFESNNVHYAEVLF